MFIVKITNKTQNLTSLTLAINIDNQSSVIVLTIYRVLMIKFSRKKIVWRSLKFF